MKEVKSDVAHPNQQQVGVAEAKIKMDMNTGSIQVEGPFHNTVLFPGMLEMAKVTIIEGRARANKENPPIEVPKLVLPKM